MRPYRKIHDVVECLFHIHKRRRVSYFTAGIKPFSITAPHGVKLTKRELSTKVENEQSHIN